MSLSRLRVGNCVVRWSPSTRCEHGVGAIIGHSRSPTCSNSFSTTAAGGVSTIIDRVKDLEQHSGGTVDSFFREDNIESYSNDALKQMIAREADALSDFVTATRRKLHMRPELMYNEKETSQHIQHVLGELGIEFSTGWGVNTHPEKIQGPGGYGVVADIGTGNSPCVLLRADIDALPIVEQTEGINDYKSRIQDQMHACGHDGHTAMLLGAASILKGIEDKIPGTIRLMFQPAEEGGAGAKRMAEEGVLENDPKPQYAFGMHVWPTLPSGTVGCKAGPILSASERFAIQVKGVGGHAAMPHISVDPVVAASSIVTNLQTIVSRSLNPLDSGVCSVTTIHGGDAFNIIPAEVELHGTIRALSTTTLLEMRDKVEKIVETTADVHGCTVDIAYSPDYYPATINDAELYETFSKHVGGLVSEEGFVREVDTTMAAEDFSFLAEKIPSTFFLLGQGSNTAPPTNFGLHHPQFALDESVLPRGVELHVNLALRALRMLHAEQAL